MKITVFFCLTVALVMAGGQPPAQADDGSSFGRFIGAESESATYRKTLARWTDEDKLYQNLELVLGIKGTYKSADFRRAYVDAYAGDHHLDAAEYTKMLADQLALAEGSIEFLIAVSARSRMEWDLVAKDPPWRIYLEGPDIGRLTPFEIRPIRRKSNRLLGYFPYISPWAKLYELRFLAPCPQGQCCPLSLVVTGVLGTARLNFPVED